MNKVNKALFYIVAAVIFLIIGSLAYLLIHYNTQERANAIEQNIKSIAEFKATQVQDWLDERLEDARTIQNSPVYHTIHNFFQTKLNTKEKEDLNEWLELIRSQYGYNNIWLLDEDFNVRLSLNDGAIYDGYEAKVSSILKQSKEIYFSDIRLDPNNHEPFFRIAVPLLDENENVYSFLIFERNPREKLYPLLQYWPISSQSAESILFRVENDSIIFLNELKFKDSVPLNFKLVSDTIFWGSAPFSRDSGIIDSRDYRGEEILGMIREISEPGWYLKVKIDKAELFAPVRKETYVYVFIFLLIMGLLSLFAHLIWKAKNIQHLETLLKLENEKNKLQKVYDLVAMNANDSIFLIDSDLRIIEANEMAVSKYGYSKEEFSRIKVTDIREDEQKRPAAHQYDHLKKEKGVVFNTYHKSKDNKIFPVEVSLSAFRSEDDRFYVSVVRDISDRIEKEERIRRLNRFYSVLSQVNSMIVKEPDEQALIRKAARIISQYGELELVMAVFKNENGRIETYIEGSESRDLSELLTLKNDKPERIFNTQFSEEVAYCNNLESECYEGPAGRDLASKGFVCSLSVPVKRGEKVLAVLIVFAKQENFFDEETTGLFRELSGDLSFAVNYIETERQQEKSKQLIRENERKLSTILQNMPGIIYRCKNDKDWTMEFISENIFDLSGWHAEEIIDNRKIAFNEIILEEDRNRVWNEVQHHISSRKAYTLGYKIMHRDGSVHTVAENALPVYDESGHLIAIEGIIFDITETEEIKLALEQTESRYKNLVDSSPFGVAMVDLSGKILIVNSPISKILNQPTAELIGKNFRQLTVSEDLKNRLIERFNRVIETINILEYEDSLDLPGGRFYMLSNYIPVLDSRSNLIGVQLITRDITEQRTAGEMIRKLSQSVEQSPISVLICNARGEIEYINKSLLENTGYKKEELIGKNPRIFKSGLMPQKIYEDLWKSISAGEVFECELLNKKKSGELFWEKATIASITDENGQIISFVGLKEDITQKKIMEEELKRQKDRAEEMNRVKTYFFNNMSHELRTPMVGILGYIDLLLSENLSPKQKEMLETVYKSSKRLHETLNSILDLSKIEAEKSVAVYSDFDINDLMRETVKLFQIIAEEKGLFLKVVDVDKPFLVVSDESLLAKILTNLVSNAIKYTESGGVTLKASKEKHFVIIEVDDTGIGIDKKYHHLIFEPFRQVSEGLSRHYEGTGLGLSVVKSYISLLGGSVTVDSQIGRGTKFTVKIPYRLKGDEDKGNAKLPDKEKSAPYKKVTGKRILLVEDDLINAGFLKKLLEPDHHVDLVYEGDQAVTSARQNKYDVILMDIGLKGKMDGVEATQIIKKDSINIDTPVIAITAYAMAGDRERILSGGLNDYLSKPFSKDEFLKMINKYLHKS